MTALRRIDLAWALLVLLTLTGVFLGEFRQGGFWVVLVIALVTALKGRLVIDVFMELGEASLVLRRLVRGFGLLVPALILVTYLWGPLLARFNWLLE